MRVAVNRLNLDYQGLYPALTLGWRLTYPSLTRWLATDFSRLYGWARHAVAQFYS